MTPLCAIVPVKPLGIAKSRLARALSPPQRRRLVLAMLEDVLATLRAVPAIADTFVVTPDADVAALAAAAGARVVAEPEARGLNAGVDTGLTAAARHRYVRALVLPADLPLATAPEVGLLVAQDGPAGRPHVAMVPAADGDGTNALLISPPGALAPSFGHGSFLAHLGQALARRIDLRVQHLAGIAGDIDRPEDLAQLRGLPRYAFLPAQRDQDQPEAT